MAGEQTTVGELRATLADLPDNTPLLVLFDQQCGVSPSIQRITTDDPVEWAEPGTIYLDLGNHG